MTNIALVETVLNLFKEYMIFMLPLYGLLGGLRFVIGWFNSIIFANLFKQNI